MSRQLRRALIVGGIGGVVASVVMGAFAMIAAATYQGTGFFTPMYHIASSVLEPTAMEASMKQAAEGSGWYFAAGPALAGAAIHMMTGAFWGVVFGLIASALALSRASAPIAGAGYGVVVMLAMAFVGLPIVAQLFDGGMPVRNMAQMVGWSTFTIEHVLFGLVVGIVWSLSADTSASPISVDGRHRARV